MRPKAAQLASQPARQTGSHLGLARLSSPSANTGAALEASAGELRLLTWQSCLTVPLSCACTQVNRVALFRARCRLSAAGGNGASFALPASLSTDSMYPRALTQTSCNQAFTPSHRPIIVGPAEATLQPAGWLHLDPLRQYQI